MKVKKFFLSLSKIEALFGFVVFLLYTIANTITVGGISGLIFDHLLSDMLKNHNFLEVLVLFWLFMTSIAFLICWIFWGIFNHLNEKHD